MMHRVIGRLASARSELRLYVLYVADIIIAKGLSRSLSSTPHAMQFSPRSPRLQLSAEIYYTLYAPLVSTDRRSTSHGAGAVYKFIFYFEKKKVV